MTGPGITGPGPAGERRDFFVSYTSSDSAWATWVAHQVELAGYTVMIQAWDFDRSSFIVQMEDAVHRSDRLLAIYSDAYLASRWSRFEWAAYMKKRPAGIIPVHIEETGFPSLLDAQVRINLIGLGEQEAREKLRREIAGIADPGHGPPDLSRHRQFSFPVIAYSVSADTGSTRDGPGTPRSTLPIDRDHIQVILLGDGQASGEALASFVSRLGVTRRCDLFDSGLSADEQLQQIGELLGGLDPEDVSDVLVIFAGRGGNHPDLRLSVRATDRSQPASTSISLDQLRERLRYISHQLRGYIILDAVNEDGGPVGSPAPGAVPVLNISRGDHGGGGLAALGDALARPAEDLAGQLPHWGPLCLEDLRVLAGGELVAEEDSPAYLVGLVPSPLAWPRTGRTRDSLDNWCVVISESDTRAPVGESVRQVVSRIANYSLPALNREYSSSRLAIELRGHPRELLAGKVMSSPGAFAHAIEQVCRAELAIFDLTNFEPAVMILLGIRAVIRRGLTVCVAGRHDPPWLGAEAPFHLREVSQVTPPNRDVLRDRILAGIRQLAQPGDSYRDLPCFDLLRAVPPDPDQRQARAFDAKLNPAILALVPFDPGYVERNWRQINEDLPEIAGQTTARLRQKADAGPPDPDEVQRPALRRTLDLDSPRVVSAQLFEAIRLTDFCLVDLTAARPNVLFELGVRLAASRLHPVVIEDRTYGQDDRATENDSADATWLENVNGQLEKLRGLLQPVEYSPGREGVFTQMVDRHLEFRRLLQTPGDPRAESLLGGLPPTGVYDLAWPHAVPGHEMVTVPVADRLYAGGAELLVDQTMGLRHLIYPAQHPLTKAAERTGLEYLVAAWLYLHFRMRAGGGADPELAGRYEELTDQLIIRLHQTGEPSDASFAAQLDRWQAEGGGPTGQRTGETND
jgi:hypothetical protein